jgi:hypothetical protein
VASAEAAGCRVIAVPSLVPIPPSPGRIVVSSLLDLRADANGIWVRPGELAPEPPVRFTPETEPHPGASPTANPGGLAPEPPVRFTP